MKQLQKQNMRSEADIQSNLFKLQKNLLQVWHDSNVEEYYQNLILSHLDSLPPNQAQSFISKQIRATHQATSRYFKLQQRIKGRQKVLSALSGLVKNQQFKKEKRTQALSEISSMLHQLRDHNLAISQMLISLHKEYKAGEQISVSDECMKILNNLDSENRFLKESFLNQHILFQSGYDPFFLYHYEMKEKQKPLYSHPIIQNLFNLTISYACRLFKAKTKILQIFSSGKYNQTKIYKKKSQSIEPISQRAIEYPKIQRFRTIERDDVFDSQRRITNTNLRPKKLSLQKAKERQRLKQGVSETQDTNIQYAPLINKQKFPTLTQQQNEDSDDNEQYYKLVPIKHTKKKNMPRSQFLLQLRNKSMALDQSDVNPIKYSLNFKDKLSPISSRELDLDQSKNRNSIFKRETIRQPLFVKKEYYKKDEDEPLDKKGQKQQQPISSSKPKQTSSGKETPLIKSTNLSQNKEIKMRPGKQTFKQLIPYLKQLNISQQLKNETFLNAKYQESLSKFQSYFSEFVVNGELKAAGLSVALPDGEYIIKLWAPLQSCDEQTNKLLLGKYIDYIQKQTSCNNIFYAGNNKSLFTTFNFSAKSQKLYFRRRANKKQAKQLQFPQFFTAKCSNLLFAQENKEINMLYSEQIEPFDQKNYYAEPSFVQINKEKLNKILALSSKISQEIADMKALNSLLQDEQLDTYEVASNMKITNISAIRLSLNINFKAAFLAGDGFFKFSGEQVYRKSNSLICRIQGSQYCSWVLFGKGFTSINAFLQNLKQVKKKPCDFSVKMFNKQLYGRMLNKNMEKCSYGNWQFSLSWKDQLQGRVKHSMTGFQAFGKESFYVALQIQSQIIFCFEVGTQDFLF